MSMLKNSISTSEENCRKGKEEEEGMAVIDAAAAASINNQTTVHSERLLNEDNGREDHT